MARKGGRLKRLTNYPCSWPPDKKRPPIEPFLHTAGRFAYLRPVGTWNLSSLGLAPNRPRQGNPGRAQLERTEAPPVAWLVGIFGGASLRGPIATNPRTVPMTLSSDPVVLYPVRSAPGGGSPAACCRASSTYSEEKVVPCS
jgi:hypothetical protein